MITLKNYNCGFGLTTIQFAGHDELHHCAIYLAARGGSVPDYEHIDILFS